MKHKYFILSMSSGKIAATIHAISFVQAEKLAESIGYDLTDYYVQLSSDTAKDRNNLTRIYGN